MCIYFYNFKSTSYISRKYFKPVSQNFEDLGQILDFEWIFWIFLNR